MEKWKEDLETSLGKALEKQHREQEEKDQRLRQMESVVEAFSTSKVVPAFAELRTELEELGKYGLNVQVDKSDVHAPNIVVQNSNSGKEFSYTLHAKISPERIDIYPEIAISDAYANIRNFTEQDLKDISEITKEDIAQNFVDNIKRHIQDII